MADKQPDYALLDAAGKPVAVIEAKRLGESLASHQIQFISYANQAGVPYAGLTDGNHWELYEMFSDDPAPIEDRLLLNLSIAGRPAHEVALKTAVALAAQPRSRSAGSGQRAGIDYGD